MGGSPSTRTKMVTRITKNADKFLVRDNLLYSPRNIKGKGEKVFKFGSKSGATWELYNAQLGADGKTFCRSTSEKMEAACGVHGSYLRYQTLQNLTNKEVAVVGYGCEIEWNEKTERLRSARKGNPTEKNKITMYLEMCETLKYLQDNYISKPSVKVTWHYQGPQPTSGPEETGPREWKLFFFEDENNNRHHPYYFCITGTMKQGKVQSSGKAQPAPGKDLFSVYPLSKTKEQCSASFNEHKDKLVEEFNERGGLYFHDFMDLNEAPTHALRPSKKVMEKKDSSSGASKFSIEFIKLQWDAAKIDKLTKMPLEDDSLDRKIDIIDDMDWKQSDGGDLPENF